MTPDQVKEQFKSWMPEDRYDSVEVQRVIEALSEEVHDIYADISEFPIMRSPTRVPLEYLSLLESYLSLTPNALLSEEQRRRRLMTVSDFIRIKGTDNSFEYWFYYHKLRMAILDLWTPKPPSIDEYVVFDPLGGAVTPTTHYSTPHFALEVIFTDDGYVIDEGFVYGTAPYIEACENVVVDGPILKGATVLHRFITPGTFYLTAYVAGVPVTIQDDGLGGFEILGVPVPGVIDYSYGYVSEVEFPGTIQYPANQVVADYTGSVVPVGSVTFQELILELQNVKPAETVLEYILIARELLDTVDMPTDELEEDITSFIGDMYQYHCPLGNPYWKVAMDGADPDEDPYTFVVGGLSPYATPWLIGEPGELCKQDHLFYYDVIDTLDEPYAVPVFVGHEIQVGNFIVGQGNFDDSAYNIAVAQYNGLWCHVKEYDAPPPGGVVINEFDIGL